MGKVNELLEKPKRLQLYFLSLAKGVDKPTTLEILDEINYLVIPQIKTVFEIMLASLNNDKLELNSGDFICEPVVNMFHSELLKWDELSEYFYGPGGSLARDRKRGCTEGH